jgi:hypothetical protein
MIRRSSKPPQSFGKRYRGSVSHGVDRFENEPDTPYPIKDSIRTRAPYPRRRADFRATKAACW